MDAKTMPQRKIIEFLWLRGLALREKKVVNIETKLLGREFFHLHFLLTFDRLSV